MTSLMDSLQTLGEGAAPSAVVIGVDQVKLRGQMLGGFPEPLACSQVLPWAELEQADSVGRM